MSESYPDWEFHGRVSVVDLIAVLLACVPRPRRSQAAMTLEAILVTTVRQPLTETGAHQVIVDGIQFAAILPCLKCEGSTDGVMDCGGYCSGRED